MNMSKQSSIEWLDVELTSLHFDYLTGQVNNSEFNERKKLIMEEAKAMHQKEIVDAHVNGNKEYTIGGGYELIAEHYYNETFNK
jgi:hypothetical protein